MPCARLVSSAVPLGGGHFLRNSWNKQRIAQDHVSSCESESIGMTADISKLHAIVNKVIFLGSLSAS